MEAQPRWKNGAAAQNTTGVARTNWIHCDTPMGIRSLSPGIMGKSMPRTRIGTDRTAEIQKRRVIEASSGLGSVVAVARSGSRAMPQMGQAPGPS